MSQKILVKNRKAYFHYSVVDHIEAGISLFGTEVKSLRLSKADIAESYCLFTAKGELEVHQFKIEKYSFGTYTNHEPNRKKKLLLHKNELFRLKNKLKNDSLSLIPLQVYFKGDYIKLELGLCKRKKVVDKEHLQKLKDQSLQKSHEEKYSSR